MTLDQNKAIATRFIEEVFVRQDERAVDELTAAEAAEYGYEISPP